MKFQSRNILFFLIMGWTGLLSSRSLAQGEPEETDELEVDLFFSPEEIVSSTALHDQEIGMSPSAVTVISRNDIEASGANNFPDLLRLVPGMLVMVASPAVTSITARLNWTNENNHFLVLIDGREANLETLGQPLWELQPLFLDDVERIEVIRGPASALYGANALAGVVSIITRAVPEKTSCWAGITVGETGLVSPAARASWRKEAWGLSLSAGGDFEGTFGNSRQSSKQIWKFRSLTQYQFSSSRNLSLDVGISQGSFSLPFGIANIDGEIAIRSVQLSYHSNDLTGQLVWAWSPVELRTGYPLAFQGIHLATTVPTDIDAHSLNAEFQYTVPELPKSLLLIIGGGGRLSWIGSDQLLDAQTFSNSQSLDYHLPGISYWEGRGGAFFHLEVTPADWVTVTSGLRFDYNTVTGPFLSPQLTAVFEPAEDHFLRLGVARSFRKPHFLESQLHLMTSFPANSPISSPEDQMKFLEFMTRVMGNPHLDNEILYSVEVGYLTYFGKRKFSLSLDFFYNRLLNEIGMKSNIATNGVGFIDLERSSVLQNNIDRDLDVFGGELALRYHPSRTIQVMFSWTHREMIENLSGKTSGSDMAPKNLFTLGIRFRTSFNLLGSLYVFTRSEFLDKAVQNPKGPLEPTITKEMSNVALVLGKLGWAFMTPQHEDVEIETGIKIFFPLSPFEPPFGSFFDRIGRLGPEGELEGGSLLTRSISVYLEGSF